MVVVCEHCDTIEIHKDCIKDEKKIRIGSFVEWETGWMGERTTHARGTVVKIRNGAWGHKEFLVDEEWGDERVWKKGWNCYVVDRLFNGK